MLRFERELNQKRFGMPAELSGHLRGPLLLKSERRTTNREKFSELILFPWSIIERFNYVEQAAVLFHALELVCFLAALYAFGCLFGG